MRAHVHTCADDGRYVRCPRRRRHVDNDDNHHRHNFDREHDDYLHHHPCHSRLRAARHSERHKYNFDNDEQPCPWNSRPGVTPFQAPPFLVLRCY